MFGWGRGNRYLWPWRRVPETPSSAALTTAALALAPATLAAATLALAAAALAPPALAPAALAIRLHINRRHVGGSARSVPVSRRRSRKHPQRRGERRCAGRHPSIRLCLDRCD